MADWLFSNKDFLVFAAASIGLGFFFQFLWRFYAREAFSWKVLGWLWSGLLALLGSALLIVNHAGVLEQKKIQSLLQGFAPTYAMEMEEEGHARVTLETSADDPLYLSLIRRQVRWLEINPIIQDVYTFRRAKDGSIQLVVDSETDYDKDGKYEGNRESRTKIGEKFEVKLLPLERAFRGESTFNDEIYTDRWGTWVSAFAPIYKAGEVEAVLGVDFPADKWIDAAAAGRAKWLAFIGVFIVLMESAIAIIAILRSHLKNKLRSAAALTRSEEQFRAISESAPVGIFMTDLQRNCHYVNPTFCATTGRQVSELFGQGWIRTLHPEDRGRFLGNWELPSESDKTAVLRFITPDGAVIWTNVRLASIHPGENRKGFVCTVEDITERKRSEEERSELQSKFHETQKLESLGLVASGVAHDFNNLLTSILGGAALARIDEKRNLGVENHLEQIEKIAQRAAELCRQLLSYSSKGKEVQEEINLNFLVKDTSHLLRLSTSKRVGLKFILAPSLPHLLGDATQLRQILMNLVINASDALENRVHGDGVIEVITGKMHLDREFFKDTYLSPDLPAGEYVFLEVRDNGAGMNSETCSRVFQPFFTTKITGRGLGLAVVSDIVLKHQGALLLESEEGKGTKFKIFLPRLLGESSGIKEEVEDVTVLPAVEWSGRGTILVVDDENEVREICMLILQHYKFDVLVAKDGIEGLELYRKHADNIVAVLMDLTMPRMDGNEAYREIHKINKDARIIMMSGYNEQDVMEMMQTKETLVFIQKPFGPQALGEKIRTIFVNG